MPKFACGFCQSKIRVPDEYIGKRVKCPGCGKPVEVPGEEPSAAAKDGAALDLSLLDDSMSGGSATAAPRKLRSIVVGCGVCSKTIHIPENRKGAVTPCPKCGTPLMVDVPDLPDTAGSTIDFKHLELDPATEPSLLGDSVAGARLGGTSASRTSTGSRLSRTGRSGTTSGSRLGNTGSFAAGATGMGGATNSQDQMQELRSLNDLKASGALTDEEYRKRKAAIYSSGGGSGGATGARAAMSRSASGASERAIKVDTGMQIPGPIKVLAGVGVVALAGFLVWQYGIQPALQMSNQPEPQVAERAEPTAEQRAAAEAAEAERVAQAEREAEEARVAAEQAEAVTWASLIPDLGPEAMEVVLVEPGRAGPAPEQSVFAMDEESDDAPVGEQVAGMASAFDTVATLPPAEPVETGPRGEIVMWDVLLPEGRTSHPLARQSAFVYQLNRVGETAFIGVGIGPAVSGLEDVAFKQWQRNEVQQPLMTGLARVPGFENSRPRVIDREQSIRNLTYQEMTFQGRDAARGNQQVLLTGVQDGFAVFYWFDGHSRVYTSWKRETLGKAVIE
ncbi:MAG: SHOCT domain-containing protein [Planctomycetota bacterium]